MLQMWSIDYVQVPDDDSKDGFRSNPQTPKKNETAKPLPIYNRLVKQINISNESIGSSLVKSGSESSLSEENTTKGSIERQRPVEMSSKEWRSKQQDEKDICSDNEEVLAATPPIPPVRRRSRIHAAVRKSEGTFCYTLITSLVGSHCFIHLCIYF